jgi:hypothetical protein
MSYQPKENRILCDYCGFSIPIEALCPPWLLNKDPVPGWYLENPRSFNEGPRVDYCPKCSEEE